ARRRAVRPGERRDLAWDVADEDRTPQLALDELLVELVHELARSPRRVDLDAVALGDRGEIGALERDLLTDALGDELEDRVALLPAFEVVPVSLLPERE